MLIQAKLKRGVEPLQIPFPQGFSGLRSQPKADELSISTRMSAYTPDEIKLIQDFLGRQAYRQELVFGSVLIDEDDPLLSMSHDELDEVEKNAHLPNSRRALSGGEISVRERVLRLRESGYYGNGGAGLLVAAR